jgi:hypothetical protein
MGHIPWLHQQYRLETRVNRLSGVSLSRFSAGKNPVIDRL